MPRTAKRMENISLSEISGVDHPAHLEEGWMVFKAAKGGGLDPAIAKAMATAAIVKAGAAATAVKPTGTAPEPQPVTDHRIARLRSAAETLADVIAETYETDDEETDDKESKVGDLNQTAAQAVAIAQQLAASQAAASQGAGAGTEGGGQAPAAKSAAPDTSAAAAAAPAAPAAAEDEILKALPEPLRKRFTDMEEELAKARDRQATESAVAKAIAWGHVPSVSPDPDSDEGVVKALKTLRSVAPEATAVLEKALDAAESALENSEFYKELGRSGQGDTGSTGPYGQLESLAKARAAEKNEPYSIAFDEVTQTPEGRKLLDQFNATAREGRR